MTLGTYTVTDALEDLHYYTRKASFYVDNLPANFERIVGDLIISCTGIPDPDRPQIALWKKYYRQLTFYIDSQPANSEEQVSLMLSSISNVL